MNCNGERGKRIFDTMLYANGLNVTWLYLNALISQNPADHFTKNLPRILFHRHVDYIMGHVPPPHSPHFMSVGASGVNTEYYPPTAIVAMVSAPRQSPYSPFIPICLPGHWCNKS